MRHYNDRERTLTALAVAAFVLAALGFLLAVVQYDRIADVEARCQMEGR